jgi:hypothetical protein
MAALLASLVACGAAVGTPPGTATGEPTPGLSTPSASVAATVGPPESAADSSGPVSSSEAGGDILSLCANDPSTPPSDLDCKDAVETALAAAIPSSPPFRAELRWAEHCPPATPCPSRPLDPNVAEVVLFLADGTGVEVTVALQDGGVAAVGEKPLSRSEIGSRATYESPAVSRPEVGPAPATVASRSALPFCGSEDAGLAGPFNVGGRQCFLGSVLAGEAAEFLSHRADVGGVPFVEVWRTTGSGPISVLLDQDGRWSQLTCGLTLLDGDQVFDHTDCAVAPIA